MARSRNIKPGFFTNEDLVELDFATRLLFAGLWTIADRDGRLEDRPKKIKMAVFPADDVDVDAMLQSLHDSKFIVRYAVDGKKLIQINTWTKHQNPHHTEKASELPDINGNLTVKSPLKPGESPGKDGGNLADSLLLIPDSLNTDCVCETPAHTQAVHNFREVTKSRPDINPDSVFQAWKAHYPPDKRTFDKWVKWVAREHSPSNKPPSAADPESRASIESLGLSLGIGKWDELKEPWPKYKARVKKGQPA